MQSARREDLKHDYPPTQHFDPGVPSWCSEGDRR
jgi:hypothetical protein